NRGRVQREDALDAGAEADATNSEGSAGGAAFLGDHNSFERLDALLDLFAFAFLEADVDANAIAGAEVGEVFAQLRFMKLLNYRMHVLYSLQTHSGGASSFKTNRNYTGKGRDCLVGFSRISAEVPPANLSQTTRGARWRRRQSVPFLRVGG